ncbi:hypothetical protein HY413_00225 [Candidatus Kaiserbacteria bacterium]|nr:hypothetical protein [Candidatus Kaiserbacteria bacterium]
MLRAESPYRAAHIQPRLIAWFTMVHILALAGLVHLVQMLVAGFYASTLATLTLATTLFFLRHLSITVGAHRYYSHRSFKVSNPFVEYVMVTLFTGCFQHDVLFWGAKHRDHHRFSDKLGDPYSVKDGAGHAHTWWIFYDIPVKPGTAPDLEVNPVVQWQRRHYLKIAIAVAFVVPTALAALWSDALGGFLVAGWLCLAVQYHATWCINSVAHLWGERRYGHPTARSLPMLGIPTVGESTAHDRHHKWPRDYRILPGSIWDIGQWAILLGAKLGVFYDLKTFSDPAD